MTNDYNLDCLAVCRPMTVDAGLFKLGARTSFSGVGCEQDRQDAPCRIYGTTARSLGAYVVKITVEQAKVGETEREGWVPLQVTKIKRHKNGEFTVTFHGAQNRRPTETLTLRQNYAEAAQVPGVDLLFLAHVGR